MPCIPLCKNITNLSDYQYFANSISSGTHDIFTPVFPFILEFHTCIQWNIIFTTIIPSNFLNTLKKFFQLHILKKENSLTESIYVVCGYGATHWSMGILVVDTSLSRYYHWPKGPQKGWGLESTYLPYLLGDSNLSFIVTFFELEYKLKAQHGDACL